MQDKILLDSSFVSVSVSVRGESQKHLAFSTEEILVSRSLP